MEDGIGRRTGSDRGERGGVTWERGATTCAAVETEVRAEERDDSRRCGDLRRLWAAPLTLLGGEVEVLNGGCAGGDFDGELGAFVVLGGDVLLVRLARGAAAGRRGDGLFAARSIGRDADDVFAGSRALLGGHLVGAVDDLGDAEAAGALGFEGDLAGRQRLAVEGDFSGDRGAAGVGVAAAEEHGAHEESKAGKGGDRTRSEGCTVHGPKGL